MLLKFLLICSLLAIVRSSQDFAYQKSCSDGPEYWCESIQNSVECNSFKHCLSTIWSKHSQYLSDNSNEMTPSGNEPNKCSNCMSCLESGYQRCPVVYKYQDQVDELKLNKLVIFFWCALYYIHFLLN